MRLLLIPWLLFAFLSPSEAGRKFEDDESLFENLNKTLLEIAMTPVEDLTLDELSAAYGMHIPQEHRQAAEELLRHREDRPLGALIGEMQTYSNYNVTTAEEFSRSVMRALLDKSYLLPPHHKLQPGDRLCRCTTRQCATISNELYSVLGPDMASFCRVDKYGHCMQSARVVHNISVIELYCALSHATEEQKEYHESSNNEHIHVCKSYPNEKKTCCKGAMCNDMPIPDRERVETVMERRVRESEEAVAFWRRVAVTLIFFLLLLLALLLVAALIIWKFVDLRELKKKMAALSCASVTRLDETATRFSQRYFTHDAAENGSSAGSESPLIAPSFTLSEAGTTVGSSIGSNPSKSFLDTETTVGCQSGSGSAVVSERTFSSHIRMMGSLGQGRFGKVYLGEWRGGEKVAVKKFPADLYESFKTESDILQTGGMSNSNILRWIGMDNVNKGSTDEFWIILEYHPNGSLYDYMEKNALSQSTFLKMMRGVVNGISFLHSDMGISDGTMEKKGVAHRDLKTKNILVKSDLTCVLADFGMAVLNDDNYVQLPKNTKKSGTVRYLSPEVLRMFPDKPEMLETIVEEISDKDEDCERNNGLDFAFYKASDMYSFALVLWECARRTHARFGNVTVAEYSMDESLAYYTDVPREPSVEDMKKAVVGKELRPPINDIWKRNPVFLEMSRIMRECWSANSTVRLTALNVKLAIDRLACDLSLNLPRGYD